MNYVIVGTGESISATAGSNIISIGMVDYASSPENVSRAGDKPLIVKAIALENFNSTPIVSIIDSNKILIENHATNFLKDLKVVFLY